MKFKVASVAFRGLIGSDSGAFRDETEVVAGNMMSALHFPLALPTAG